MEGQSGEKENKNSKKFIKPSNKSTKHSSDHILLPNKRLIPPVQETKK
jgi:hypothetical protein